MIHKSKQTITDYITGKSYHVIMKVRPVSVRSLILGGGMVLGGIIFLICDAFRLGADAFEVAEMELQEKCNNFVG